MIEAGARLERSTVRGPTIIGAGQPHRGLLRRALLGDRRERHDRALRGRALDRARRLAHQRPLRPDGGEPDRPQRGARAHATRCPRPTASWSATTRRSSSIEDPDHRRRRHARPRRRARRARRSATSRSRWRARARHHATARRSSRRASSTIRAPSSTARRGPTWTAPRSTRARRRTSTGRGAGNVAAAAAAVGVPVDLSLDRLRLRRHASEDGYVESDEVGPLSAYGRSKLAGERADRGRQPAPLRSSARPGCSASTAATSSTRCWASRRTATRSWSCATRSAARPTPATSPRGSCGCSTARTTASTTWPAAGAARGTSSRWRSSARPGVECRVLSMTSDMLDRPGAAAGVLGARQRARAPGAAARLARGAGRLPRRARDEVRA